MIMNETFSSLYSSIPQNNYLKKQNYLKDAQFKIRNDRIIKEEKTKERSFKDLNQLIIRSSSFKHIEKMNNQIQETNQNICHAYPLIKGSKNSLPKYTNHLNLHNLPIEKFDKFSSSQDFSRNGDAFKFDCSNCCTLNSKQNNLPFDQLENIKSINSNKLDYSHKKINICPIASCKSIINKTPKANVNVLKHISSLEVNRINMLNSILKEGKIDKDKAQLFRTLYGNNKGDFKEYPPIKKYSDTLSKEILKQDEGNFQTKINIEESFSKSPNNLKLITLNNNFSNKYYFHINQKLFSNLNKKQNLPKLSFKGAGIDNFESSYSDNLSKPIEHSSDTIEVNKNIIENMKIVEKNSQNKYHYRLHCKEENKDLNYFETTNTKQTFTYKTKQWKKIKNLINKRIQKADKLESKLIENYSSKHEELEKPIKEIKFLVKYMKYLTKGKHKIN